MLILKPTFLKECLVDILGEVIDDSSDSKNI